MSLTLRPATPADRFLLRRWLSARHVAAWWGSKDSAEAAIAIALDSPSALCRIIVLDNEPIGYIHALDTRTDASSRRRADALVPAGSYEANLFIGADAHRGRGHGARALALLRDEVFATTLAAALAIKVSIKNEAAVRMIEKAAFRWRGIIDDPLIGPAWLLRFDRPAG